MKVILLHNPKAGRGGQPGADQLLREIRAAGHTVIYQSTTQKGAKWIMLEPADLVVVAGGDGTVRKAALAVAGRGVPLAIIPLGTANNLAKTLNISAPGPNLFHNLDTVRRVRLDVGIATGPWGKSPFIESAGAGLLARVISYLSQDKATVPSAPSVEHASEQLRRLLENYPARPCSVRVDGREFSENLLLVEGMNTRSVGPNVILAPQSDPGDGLLDFVFLKEANREKFAAYLDQSDDDPDPPPVEIIRGRSLQLAFSRPEPVHVDDNTWPNEEIQAAASNDKPDEEHTPISLEIRLTEEPIEVLGPTGC